MGRPKLTGKRSFMKVETAEFGKWVCGFGNCRRPAAFILTRPTMHKGHSYMRYSGACETCGRAYSKKYGVKLK